MGEKHRILKILNKEYKMGEKQISILINGILF